MNKRILSTALVFLTCVCMLSFSAFAATPTPTATASYANGVVRISGTGYTKQTDYIVRIVDTKDSSLTAMTQTKAKSNGDFFAFVTTGALGTLSDYTAYINDLNGNNVATVDNIKGSGSSSSSSSSDSHHHSNSGSTKSEPAAPTAPSTTYASDTTSNFAVSSAYQFKITSKNGKAPVLTVGTSGVFTVQLVKTTGNDYFFKLTAIGAPGAQAGIYVNGERLLVATVNTTNSGVKCDTTKPFKVKAGASYVFKLTAKTKPAFVCGNGSVFAVSFTGQKGSDYFFKATAVGKAGNCTGFYVNGEKTPCTVANIA